MVRAGVNAARNKGKEGCDLKKKTIIRHVLVYGWKMGAMEKVGEAFWKQHKKNVEADQGCEI